VGAGAALAAAGGGCRRRHRRSCRQQRQRLRRFRSRCGERSGAGGAVPLSLFRRAAAAALRACQSERAALGAREIVRAMRRRGLSVGAPGGGGGRGGAGGNSSEEEAEERAAAPGTPTGASTGASTDDAGVARGRAAPRALCT
jgi:hypothetical protein